MGKRKSSRAPPKKVKVTMEREFNCLFCNHEKCIEVKLDRKLRRGTLRCAICHEEWSQAIGNLTDATDVYHSWIDAIEAANKDAKHDAGSDREEEGEAARPAPKEEADSDDSEPESRRRQERAESEASDRGREEPEEEAEGEDDLDEPSSRRIKRRKAISDSDDE